MTLLDWATLLWVVCILSLLVLGPFEDSRTRSVKVALRLVGLAAGAGFLAKVYTTFEPFVRASGA